MASGPGAHLISVVKYEKYALRGVLDFFWGGVIFYMRTCTMYCTIIAAVCAAARLWIGPLGDLSTHDHKN